MTACLHSPPHENVGNIHYQKQKNTVSSILGSLESVFEESQAKKKKGFFFCLPHHCYRHCDWLWLLVHFELGSKSEWVAWIHFESGLDDILKICHENKLAFTLIFGLHDEIILVLYIQWCNFEWELPYKRIQSPGHKFISWCLPLGAANLGTDFMTKRTLRNSLWLPSQHIDCVRFQSALDFIIFLLVLLLSITIKTSFTPEEKITREISILIRLVVKWLNDGYSNIIINEDSSIIRVSR